MMAAVLAGEQMTLPARELHVANRPASFFAAPNAISRLSRDGSCLRSSCRRATNFRTFLRALKPVAVQMPFRPRRKQPLSDEHL